MVLVGFFARDLHALVATRQRCTINTILFGYLVIRELFSRVETIYLCKRSINFLYGVELLRVENGVVGGLPDRWLPVIVGCPCTVPMIKEISDDTPPRISINAGSCAYHQQEYKNTLRSRILPSQKSFVNHIADLSPEIAPEARFPLICS